MSRTARVMVTLMFVLFAGVVQAQATDKHFQFFVSSASDLEGEQFRMVVLYGEQGAASETFQVHTLETTSTVGVITIPIDPANYPSGILRAVGLVHQWDSTNMGWRAEDGAQVLLEDVNGNAYSKPATTLVIETGGAL